MNRRTLALTALTAALAAAVAGVALAAPNPGETSGHRQTMRKLDVNGDGVIDRSEAAAHPRLAEKFATLDKNGDGKLDASERPAHKGKRGRGHGGHHGIGRVAAADSDGDGRISRSEAAGLGRIGEQFAQIDRNRDGYLVRSELQAHHANQRSQHEAEFAKRADERFAAADLNRDGKLSRVEASEKMPKVAKSFAFLDEDRDGYLTREDLKPMRH